MFGAKDCRSAVVALVVGLTGCATLLKQAPDQVHFHSDPDGAEVIVDGRTAGETPVSLRLDAARSRTVVFRKSGYEDVIMTLDSHVEPVWVVLDVFMGVWPAAIDAATGKWKAFDERHHFAALRDLAPDRWKDARDRDDIEGYEEFLRQHPSSEFATEAGARLERLRERRDWDEACEADDVEAYESFLAQHPSSGFRDEATVRLGRLHSETAFASARRSDGIAAYERFLLDHPSSPRAGEARARLELLRRYLPGWQQTQRRATLASYQRYVSRNPESPYVSGARLAIEDIGGRDIADLLSDGRVEVEVSGSSIRNVRVRVRRRVPHRVTVRMPVGTYFVSRNERAQNMVATRPVATTLTSDQWVSVSVPAACANRARDIPGRGVGFDVQAAPHSNELAALMPVLDRAEVGFPTRQAAVWIVTDNATYSALGTLVQGMSRTRVIRERDAAHAMRICDEAGIDVTRKAIWRDRQRILEGLEEGDLKEWLEGRASSPDGLGSTGGAAS